MEEKTKQIIRDIITEGDCREQHNGNLKDFIIFLQIKYCEAIEEIAEKLDYKRTDKEILEDY